jgi:two-component system chemotaxis response regulator CheB
MAGEAVDLVVMGGSAGALEAVLTVLPALAPPAPMAVLLVIHGPAETPSRLRGLLGRRVKHFIVETATDEAELRSGLIYLPRAGHHLGVEDGVVRVTPGPRENGFRPAIDPLFRSAAAAHGAEVTGVLLSGALDDGVAGLAAIKHAGGVTVVQDPAEAVIDCLPRTAIEQVRVDQILPAAGIARLLNLPADARRQGNGAPSNVSPQAFTPSRSPTMFTCPECGGSLWEADEGHVLRFRCHVGHAYSVQSLDSQHGIELEKALWTAFRTLREHAAMQRRLAEHAGAAGMAAIAEGHERRAVHAEQRAMSIQQALNSVPPGELRTSLAGP